MKQISNFEVYIFDLDDTLLDTYGCVLKPAVIEACDAMIDSGLNTSSEKCTQFFYQQKSERPRQCFFLDAAHNFGFKSSTSAEQLQNVGKNAFYNREIREELKLLPHAIEVLESLHDTQKPIYLVTSGEYKAQWQKINLLGIKKYFSEIYISENSKGHKKTLAFQKILNLHTNIQPRQILCVGNRRDNEISQANQLGLTTCLFQYGEYIYLQPGDTSEVPHFEVKSMKELKKYV